MRVWLVQHRVISNRELAADVLGARTPLAPSVEFVGVFSTAERATEADRIVRQHAIDPAGHTRVSEVTPIMLNEIQPTFP